MFPVKAFNSPRVVTNVFIGILFLTLLCPSVQSNADNFDEKRSTAFNNLSLSPQLQKDAGISIQALFQTTHQPEALYYGRTLSQADLLEFQSHYSQQLAQLKAAYTKKQLAKTQHSRLHKEAMEAQWQADNITLKALRSRAEAQWGQAIVSTLIDLKKTPNILGSKSPQLFLYIDRPDNTNNPMPPTISIAHNSNRQAAVSATLIDGPPIANNLNSGLRFFYQTTEQSFFPNQPLVAFVPLVQQAISGFIIPESAIIHHLGQHFIYLKQGLSTFSRQLISIDLPVFGGVLVNDDLSKYDGVVVLGAQMLFSEEFKSGIPEEDDDD